MVRLAVGGVELAVRVSVAMEFAGVGEAGSAEEGAGREEGEAGAAVRLAAEAEAFFCAAIFSARFLLMTEAGADFCQRARVSASGWRLGTR